MQIRYKTTRLQKSVASLRDIQKNYGTRAKLIVQRTRELESAATLEVMRTIPAANCHELVGDLKGLLAVDISGNHRIVFEPFHDPIPLKEDGGLDWVRVTIIRITKIGKDYH